VKELPKPTFLVEAFKICDDVKEAFEIASQIGKLVTVKVGLNIVMICFLCSRKPCELFHYECPLGGLFNLKPSKYKEVKEDLKRRGFNVSWLDEYYKFNQRYG